MPDSTSRQELLKIALRLAGQVNEENSRFHTQIEQLQLAHRGTIQRLLRTVSDLKRAVEALPPE